MTDFEDTPGSDIKVGDTIRIGNGAIDWDVVAVVPHRGGYRDDFKLQSGMTGRHIYSPVDSSVYKMVKRGGALAYGI